MPVAGGDALFQGGLENGHGVGADMAFLFEEAFEGRVFEFFGYTGIETFSRTILSRWGLGTVSMNSSR